MNWSTACQDWESRIVKGESLITFPPLFPQEADRALSIFRELRFKNLQGRPTLGDVGRQWLFDFVATIFGAYDSDAGRRLIQEFFLLISKKNSKSSSAAAVMITALLLNWRESAEYLILAPTVEVAANSFSHARDMVRVDDELDALLEVREYQRLITHRNTGATLKIVAAESETVSGKIATGILVDELHEFGKRENAENMLREATGGLMSRPEGFVIYLTTQSDKPPAGIFKKKLDYARDVRDGKIEDKCFLPVMYEFPKQIIDEKAYFNPKFFYMTNPNLGASVDEATINREFKKAEHDGIDSMCGFAAKHLNVEIGLALGSNRWAGADFWEAASGKVTLDILLEQSEVVVIGVDGGGLDDLLGLAIIGRNAETRDWLLWTRAWCNPVALERRKSEAPRYRDFEKDGDLVIVNRIGEDIDQIGDIITKCDDSGLLDRIGVDPYGIGDIVAEAQARGIEFERTVNVPQGWRLNGAVLTTERRLAEKTLVHGGQRLMSWCVGNAKSEIKGNNVYITKQASGTGKIDPLMATFNAVALMAMNPEARCKKSIYEGLTTEQIIERMAV